jgi:hypothetical protein
VANGKFVDREISETSSPTALFESTMVLLGAAS